MSHEFPTTSLTMVESMQSQDRPTRELSLEKFCALYYAPVYGYARHLGLKEEDAKDRVQDFFVKVVGDSLLLRYDRNQGARLSAWLIRCFKNLLINHDTASKAQKRGRQGDRVPFDEMLLEQSYQAAHVAHLEPLLTFDLMLARGFWREARSKIVQSYLAEKQQRLVSELLPFVLLGRWPPPPIPSITEMARLHGLSPMTLKAFYNRTLKVKARRVFGLQAAQSSPGITTDEVEQLWKLLCEYSEAD